MTRREFSVLSTRRIDPSLISLAASERIKISVTEFIKINLKVDEETRRRANLHPSEVVVFTSRNAVMAASELVSEEIKNGWSRIYGIEGSTSELVHHLFPNSSLSTAPDANSLGKLIVNKEPLRTVAFFCGNKRRNELPRQLADAGFEVIEQQVYETVPCPATVSQKFDGIMFFSPSAVQSFFSANSTDDEVVCFSIGHTTTEELTKHGNYKIITAHQSSESSIVESVMSYYRRNN